MDWVSNTIKLPSGSTRCRYSTKDVLATVAVIPIAIIMIMGPTSNTLRYSLKRRPKLRGLSTRQTKLKLSSNFCAIDNAEYSKSPRPTPASVEPLMLSTKPMIFSVSSSARGPSGMRKLSSRGSMRR